MHFHRVKLAVDQVLGRRVKVKLLKGVRVDAELDF